MALWDKLGGSGSVDDRRGMSRGLLFGLPTGVVAIGASLLLGYFGISADPRLVEQFIQITGVDQTSTEQPAEFKGEDSYEQFASTVLGSTDEYWQKQFALQNQTYQKPQLVLFRDRTNSACGVASSDIGPHYCPLDKTIYLDETFFDTLKTELGGSNGDIAQAYVIAHEVGHHVQNERNELRAASSSNSASIRTELQADCYAGLWARILREQNILENDDEINEALSAASAVGDDRIQGKTSGQISPETWDARFVRTTRCFL